MEPLIYTFSSKSEDMINQDCLSNGTYCAFQSSIDNQVSGRTILLEAIRQNCIAEKEITYFFNYARKFRKCDKPFETSCSDSIIKSLKIDSESIQKCINQTFSINPSVGLYENANVLLKEHKQRQKTLMSISFPDIFINGLSYKVN